MTRRADFWGWFGLHQFQLVGFRNHPRHHVGVPNISCCWLAFQRQENEADVGCETLKTLKALGLVGAVGPAGYGGLSGEKQITRL